MNVAIIDPSGFTLPYDHCLASALAKQGCNVMLATTTRPPSELWADQPTHELCEHFYRFGGRLPRNKVRTFVKGCEHPLDLERLIHRLQRMRPDIIHFQWVPLPIVDNFFLHRISKIAPLVLTVHDTEPFHGAPSSRLQLIGLKAAYKRFDHYIVHTYQSRDVLLSQLALSEDRISVIPHGVFSYYRELISNTEDPSQHDKSGLSGDKKILSFGIIKPYKGIDILLEAFARLPLSIVEDTILQIVGSPKMHIEPLKASARHLGIEDRIHWDLRFVEEIEVATYFAEADVIVLPYRRIDQSGVFMTALAFEKPIVASRIGGFAEIITDGKHGFLTEPGDVDSLAEALARILLDRKLRAQIGESVRELSRGALSWESIASETLKVYGDLKRR